jgi:hypothetical protein
MHRVSCFIATFSLGLGLVMSARGADIDGLWLGYERLEKMPFENKGDRWFYENRLSIADGAVRLQKLPAVRNGKRITYSASDGAFPVFRGRLVARDGSIIAVLEIESCDYCGQVVGAAVDGHKAWGVAHHGVERQGEPKNYPVGVGLAGSITLDGVTFHRVDKFP